MLEIIVKELYKLGEDCRLVGLDKIAARAEELAHRLHFARRNEKT